MSAVSLQVHPLINNRGLRQNRGGYDELRPRIANPAFTGSRGRGTRVAEPPKVYENPLKYTRKRSPSPRPQINRIHSHNLPKPSAAPPIILSSLSFTSVDKENIPSRSGATKTGFSYATKSTNPWLGRTTYPSPPIRSPNKQSGRGPLTLTFSNSVSTDTKPSRSMLISSSSVPTHVKRRCELSETEHKNTDHFTSKHYRTQETYKTRHAQGHKVPPRSRSASRIPENVVTTQDFDCHRREVHSLVSTLGSRVGVLESTIAAALPVVVEARLLWMENAIIRAPTKLGTTRRAFCEYYGNPRYETYTQQIRTRAYYLGLTMEDLEYLQERLDSLGSQSAKQETLLISPFGGANQSGDKTMVDAYRRDSKHGAYARRIWRVCYESVYSVDENWMLPVPSPDAPTLAEKIKGWLHGS